MDIHVNMEHREHCNLRSIFELFYVPRNSLAWSTDARLHAGQYASQVSWSPPPRPKARPYWICRCILYDGWIIHQTRLLIRDQKSTPNTGLQHSTLPVVYCLLAQAFSFFFSSIDSMKSIQQWKRMDSCILSLSTHVLHLHPPAVDHHGPGIWRIACLYPPQESQDGGGVLGHTMVWPGHELELSYLSLLTGAILQGDSGKDKGKGS